jgi:hypothetical protein
MIKDLIDKFGQLEKKRNRIISLAKNKCIGTGIHADLKNLSLTEENSRKPISNCSTSCL